MVASVYFIHNDAVQRVLTLNECIEAIEDAYREWDAGRAAIRAKTNLYVYNLSEEETTRYNFASMEGGVQKLGLAAIRMRSDLQYNILDRGRATNPRRAGKESKFCGLVFFFDTRSGLPLAIINDGYLQHARVAACAGIAAKYLARKDAKTLCLLGSQWMARTHALAFCAVRPISLIQVYSPNREHREGFCREMEEKLGVEVRPKENAGEAVKGADLVACCTNSHRKAVLQGEWLADGMFISNVLGAELDDTALSRIDYTVRNQPFRNLQQAVAVAGAHPEGVEPPSEGTLWLKQANDQTPLLSHVIVGKAKGRTDDKQITFFSNNEGTGVQFAAVGSVIISRLEKTGFAGIDKIPLDWFLQDIPD